MWCADFVNAQWGSLILVGDPHSALILGFVVSGLEKWERQLDLMSYVRPVGNRTQSVTRGWRDSTIE